MNEHTSKKSDTKNKSSKPNKSAKKIDTPKFKKLDSVQNQNLSYSQTIRGPVQIPSELIFELYPDSEKCSYYRDRDDKMASFRYLIVQNATQTTYHTLLERGWRRFGKYFFVPICKDCKECISIRQPILDFTFSKNHKRDRKSVV